MWPGSNLTRSSDKAILVVYREDFFLPIDRRPAFDVEGMDGDKAHLMLALDPANRFKMMSLDTNTPHIVMPPVNPAPGVTHGPAPGDAGSSANPESTTLALPVIGSLCTW